MLHVIQADYGDSFLLENREEEVSQFVLIDGGPRRTFTNHLLYALEEIVPKTGRLDRVVLTHIDNDHLGGVIRLLQDVKINPGDRAPSRQIGGIWHNTFRQNICIDQETAPRVLELAEKAEWKGLLSHLPAEAVRGIRQGEQVSRLAESLGIPVNAGFKEGLILHENAPAPWKMDNLKIWVIGPRRHHLQRLQREWLEWLEKKVPAPVTRAAEKDSSVPNLSSIVLLAEAGGRRILLTGDGTSQDILEGLKALGKLDSTGKLHVEILKLPHHGSQRNVTKEFFELVSADQYVISGNGQNGNPEPGTLAWIVTCAKSQQRTIQILATNETNATRELIQKYPPRDYGYTLQYLTVGQHYLTV